VVGHHHGIIALMLVFGWTKHISHKKQGQFPLAVVVVVAIVVVFVVTYPWLTTTVSGCGAQGIENWMVLNHHHGYCFY